MRSAQADTASKPASKTHLSTVEQFFLTKIIQQYFNMFTFAVKLITFFALFDICFVDMNPSIRGFGAPDWAFKQLRVKPNNPGLNKNSTQLTKAVGFRETSETSPKTTGFHSYNHTWQVLSSLQSNVHLRWDQIELPRTPPRGHAPQWRLKWFQWNWDIFLTFKDDVRKGRKSPVI